MVTNRITSKELRPVIVIPNTICKARRLRATMAIDSPTESPTLSSIFIPLKKTSVQAKPGRKNTMIIPRSALNPGTTSKIEKSGDNQPKPYTTPFNTHLR